MGEDVYREWGVVPPDRPQVTPGRPVRPVRYHLVLEAAQELWQGVRLSVARLLGL